MFCGTGTHLFEKIGQFNVQVGPKLTTILTKSFSTVGNTVGYWTPSEMVLQYLGLWKLLRDIQYINSTRASTIWIFRQWELSGKDVEHGGMGNKDTRLSPSSGVTPVMPESSLAAQAGEDH